MIYISLIVIFLGIFLLILSKIVIPFNKNYPKSKKNNQKYCILIPARNESKVIEKLLISIENQTRKIDSQDVYIIVENINDPTVDIAKKHGMNIVLRRDLTKKRKGYALDDAVCLILEQNKKYDAYFVFDADNVLSKDFMELMHLEIEKGYDIGIGYRNNKNGNNLISCCSALSFSLQNTLNNEVYTKYSTVSTVTGTGFYIRGEVIENLKGYPFNSLTEDYELTLYCVLNNLTTTYNNKAIYYDEQPEDFKTTITQRTRWIKGYFESRKKYIKDIFKSLKLNDINFASKIIILIGYNATILLFFGVFLLLISILIKYSFIAFVYSFILSLFLLYLILFVISIVLIHKENGKMNMKVSKIKLILYNPIFLSSFIFCFFKAILKKNIEWKAIVHDKELKL